MINLWTHYSVNHQRQPLPVVFTEENWSNNIFAAIDAKSNQFCSYIPGCEGTYLADLMTWLDRNGYAASGPVAVASVPIRVSWYRGSDRLGDINGLYTEGGSGKRFLARTCRSTHDDRNTDLYFGQSGPGPTNADMPNYYNQLRYSACY